jgi:hypothetical protein
LAQYPFALTIRQVFYRLVATADFEKTEKGYNGLCKVIVRARRAGLIPMNAIRAKIGVVTLTGFQFNGRRFSLRR